MSYKFSTGSVRRGDIYYEDDNVGAQTYIDFGQDTITLSPSASAILYAEKDAVGIGTTDPQTTLHVKGDPGQFRVEDTTVDYAYTIDCDGDGIRTHFGDMTGVGDEDSFMTFGAYTGINRLDTAARDFHIYGTNTTTGFYFDESAGKFGIGTTSPDEKLEVAGNLQVAGNDPRIKIDADTDSHPGLELYENGTRKWIVFNDYTNDNLTFKTNSNTRMSIEQAGDVGIGTTSPDEKLHIAGNLKVDGDAPEVTVRRDNNADASTIQFQGSGGVVGAYVKFLGDESGAGGTNNDLALGTGASVTERMRIRGDGNVGIGTQAPGSKLETSGSVGFNVTSFTADASIGETHYTCVANCGSNGANGSVTLTLPAATDAMMGRVYVFKRADTGSGVFGANLVIARNGAYIDGDTDNLQLGNGDCYTIQCIGQASGWIVLGQYVPI